MSEHLKIVKVEADWDDFIICEHCGKRLTKKDYAYVVLWGMIVLCRRCADKLRNKKLDEFFSSSHFSEKRGGERE